MDKSQRFLPQDIGAELFPAITRGLYRDPLDALREYVQNGIDARATSIEITLSRDVVTIFDNGCGMTPAVARQAIRLGLSEKNPLKDVGFRGIGIYAGFEFCDLLEIHTRGEGQPSLIKIRFAKIRELLAEDEARRAEGNAPVLHLQSLMDRTVEVGPDATPPLDEDGTLVQLVGLRGNVAQRLSARLEVERYLQNTVPLPFDPEFSFGTEIEGRFAKEDYRVVNLSLSSGGEIRPVYRPYTNALFQHGGRISPKYFQVSSPKTRTKYGFAWVCLNDDRSVLSRPELRGLLLKKFGFSVGDRSSLESLFPRTVLYRRVTGEIVVQHRDLVPNAARSDFEHSDSRLDFKMALDQLASDVSTWADGVQKELKAINELAEVSVLVFEIHERLPGARSNTDELLEFNRQLGQCERRLKTHARKLTQLRAEAYRKTSDALTEATRTVRDLLAGEKRSPKNVLARSIQRKADAKAVAEETASEAQKTIVSLLESLDVSLSSEVRAVFEYIENSILKSMLTPEQLSEELDGIREFLEERN